MRRALEILGWSLLGLVALVVVVVGGALLALQTAPVQARLTALIEDAASQEGGLGVEIGSLDGTLPVDVTVRDLVLSDPDGAWLTVDRARVAWRPLDLLRGRLTVATVEAGTIAVARAPALPPGAETEEPGGAGLPQVPQLPVGIVVERLAIDA
ncbi:MAG: hypothetical protein GVY27_09310, partial [Deinococcus-Thermus bacterium]|nr:hypothetical protein [Deinococcota bacterium]